MAHYFSFFPTIEYDLFRKRKVHEMTNIMKRFRIIQGLDDKASIYSDYSIEVGDTPSIVANHFYDDPTLDWIIILPNKIIDPFFDWPLEYQQFLEFITKKYGSITTAKSQVHHYERVLQDTSVLFDGTIIKRKVARIDKDTFNALPTSDKVSVSNFDYEERLNESRRDIKIIDPDFIEEILEQTEDIFSNAVN